MPFNCFKYNGFYTSSKRYHTAAKQSAAAFFDSHYNYIRQNSQLVLSLESLSQNGKKFPNPHPANSATSHYLLVDHSYNTPVLSNDDENISEPVHTLKNPINIVLPLNHENIILSVNNSNNYQQFIKKIPNISQAINSTQHLANKIQSKQQPPQIQRAQQLHTSVTSKATVQPSTSPISSSKTLVEEKPAHDELKYFEPVSDIPTEQNNSTYLHQQTLQIDNAFKDGQYEKINSIYMAIKRNDIVPSRKVYAKVLKSICLREIDDSMDDQLSALLNVYQDLIANKIKPDLEIYSVVINQLLDSSIRSATIPDLSSNGADFFKIAIDIYNASNCTHVQHFDASIIDQILIGMNFYPGLINMKSLIHILSQQPGFIKNHVYYASLINYCKFSNDAKFAQDLYEEFKTESADNKDLTDNQFIIYSCFISTLVNTNETSLATKFLDKLLTSIKNYDNYESKVTMLLSSYLLALSKINQPKALEIWAQFNRVEWIPEFTYDFYLNLLNDSLSDYQTSLKLYNYMSALHQSSVAESNVATILFTPPRVNSLSKFLMMAIEQDDKSTILKLLKESFIRESTFEYEVYPTLFQYLNNEDLIVRITNSNGLNMSNGFEFLTFLTSNIPNFPIYGTANTEFFKKLIDEYDMTKPQNYLGFYQVFNSIFQVEDLEDTNAIIELCSPLIIEFNDLNNYYTEFDSLETMNFKNQLNFYFKTLISSNNYDTKLLSTTASDAIALLHDTN